MIEAAQRSEESFHSPELNRREQREQRSADSFHSPFRLFAPVRRFAGMRKVIESSLSICMEEAEDSDDPGYCFTTVCPTAGMAARAASSRLSERNRKLFMGSIRCLHLGRWCSVNV
jgi:hypothetical protein